MKKGILALTAVSFSFCYQLAISKNNINELKNCGINCVVDGDVCIFFEGEDKAQAERIRNYIFNEFGIHSFYVNDKKFKKLNNIYSYQIASLKNLKNARVFLRKVKHLPDARIEKIGNYYVVRVGIFNSLKEAKKFKLPYFLTKCNYISKRVVE